MSKLKIGGIILAVLIVLLAILNGLAMREDSYAIVTDLEEYEITAIDPPQWFRLDLRNTKTGVEYHRVSVSKHYSRWRSINIGDRLFLHRKDYRNGSYSFYSSEIREQLESKQ